LLRRWTAADPQAAAHWVRERLSGQLQVDAATDVAAIWVHLDRALAIAWGRDLPRDPVRNQALKCIAYELAREDPGAALELAGELPRGQMLDELIRHAAAQWAVSAPEQAAAWARQLDPSADKFRIVAAVATAWAESDAEAAVRFALDALPMGKAQDDVLIGAVQRITATQPQIAAKWALDFPPGNLRDTALETVVLSWAHQDAKAAQQWLTQNYLGDSADLARVAFVQAVAPTAPEAAATIFSSITGLEMRARGGALLYESWAHRDKMAARTWLRGADLSGVTKQRLLNLAH
jgi:hypothetical protein